ASYKICVRPSVGAHDFSRAVGAANPTRLYSLRRNHNSLSSRAKREIPLLLSFLLGAPYAGFVCGFLGFCSEVEASEWNRWSRCRNGVERQLFPRQMQMFLKHRNHQRMILPLRQARNRDRPDVSRSLQQNREAATMRHIVLCIKPAAL